MKRLLRLPLIVAAILAVSGIFLLTHSATPVAQADDVCILKYKIAGTVKDDAGKTISGATVHLFPANANDGAVTTDGSGHYAFNPVAPMSDGGSYTLYAEKEGARSDDLSVKVGPDKTDADLLLKSFPTGSRNITFKVTLTGDTTSGIGKLTGIIMTPNGAKQTVDIPVSNRQTTVTNLADGAYFLDVLDDKGHSAELYKKVIVTPSSSEMSVALFRPASQTYNDGGLTNYVRLTLQGNNYTRGGTLKVYSSDAVSKLAEATLPATGQWQFNQVQQLTADISGSQLERYFIVAETPDGVSRAHMQNTDGNFVVIKPDIPSYNYELSGSVKKDGGAVIPYGSVNIYGSQAQEAPILSVPIRKDGTYRAFGINLSRYPTQYIQADDGLGHKSDRVQVPLQSGDTRVVIPIDPLYVHATTAFTPISRSIGLLKAWIFPAARAISYASAATLDCGKISGKVVRYGTQTGIQGIVLNIHKVGQADGKVVTSKADGTFEAKGLTVDFDSDNKFEISVGQTAGFSKDATVTPPQPLVLNKGNAFTLPTSPSAPVVVQLKKQVKVSVVVGYRDENKKLHYLSGVPIKWQNTDPQARDLKSGELRTGAENNPTTLTFLDGKYNFTTKPVFRTSDLTGYVIRNTFRAYTIDSNTTESTQIIAFVADKASWDGSISIYVEDSDGFELPGSHVKIVGSNIDKVADKEGGVFIPYREIGQGRTFTFKVTPPPTQDNTYSPDSHNFTFTLAPGDYIKTVTFNVNCLLDTSNAVPLRFCGPKAKELARKPRSKATNYVVGAIQTFRSTEESATNAICYISVTDLMSEEAAMQYSSATDPAMAGKCPLGSGSYHGRLAMTTEYFGLLNQGDTFSRGAVWHELGHSLDNLHSHKDNDFASGIEVDSDNSFSAVWGLNKKSSRKKEMNNIWGTASYPPALTPDTGHEDYWRTSPLEGFAEEYEQSKMVRDKVSPLDDPLLNRLKQLNDSYADKREKFYREIRQDTYL